MDYQMQADTTFIDISDKQIKELHDKVFGETIMSDQSINMIVKLELTYIPFLLFIVIMVTAVNIRWNRVYKRISKVSENMEMTKDQSMKVGMLKAQKMNVYDRIFVYLVVWGSSLYVDTILMASGLFQFPWISIPVIITVVYKKLKVLVNTSSLTGVDDTDIMNRFDNILDKMVIAPLVEGVSEKIKKHFTK